MHYVYILKSQLKTSEIYIGSTNDLKKRVRDHNDGKEISTKRYKPWSLIYYEAYISENLSRLREKRLKYHGNAIRELKKRIGLLKWESGADRGLPSTNKSGAGFTLLELLLSVAIISLLAGLSLPVSRTLMMKNDLDIAATTVTSSLRRAQVLSQAVDGDVVGVNAIWRVKAQSGSIVIFKGSSYAGRDTNFDETFDMPTTISVSGTTEVVFTKFTGLPQTTGTINLATESDSRSVTINEKGMVDY